MSQPFRSNIFESILKPEWMNEIIKGINSNLHFAFEFHPGQGEEDFVSVLTDRLKREPLTILHIALKMTTGPEHLARQISRAAVGAFAGDIKKIESTLKKLIPTATTKMVMGKTDTPYIDFDYGTDINKLLGNLFDVPEIIGMEENRRSVVIWSGFNRLKGIIREEGMRLFIEKARRHAITAQVMIGNGISKTAAKLGGRMENQVRTITSQEIIPDEQIREYIMAGFREAGREISDGSLQKILELAEGRIGYIRRICLNLINTPLERGTQITGENLAGTVEKIIKESGTAYLALWNLLNNRQKSLILGICQNDEKSIYSARFIKKYGFGTATNLQAALRALCKKEILLKHNQHWSFADPFFREWVSRSAEAVS